MYEADEKLWELDDDRIKALYVGDISGHEFQQMITAKDPFEIRSGKIIVVAPEEYATRKTQYIKQQIDYINKTGGLVGSVINANKDAFLKTYPEHAEKFISIQAEIDKESCKGCTANAKYQPLVDILLKTPYDGRDLSLLKVDDKTMRRLKGEPVVHTSDKVFIHPYSFDKVYPPKLEVPYNLQQDLQKGRFTLVKSNLTLTPSRESCWDCVKKHLFTCVIFTREILSGYTKDKNYCHEDYLLANFEQALDESQKFTDTHNKMFPLYDLLIRKDYKAFLEGVLKLIDNEENMKTDEELLLVIGYLSDAGDRMMNIDVGVAEQIRSIRAGLARQKENLNTLK